MSKYGSRKFIIAMSLIACATILGMYDKMESGAIGLVFGLVGGGYGFANVMDKKKGGDG
jgi:hypothetical protein